VKVDKWLVHRAGLVVVAGELALRGAAVAETRTVFGGGLRVTWPDGSVVDFVVMASSQSRWQFRDVGLLDARPPDRPTFFSLTDVSAPLARTYVIPVLGMGEIARAAEKNWRDRHGGERPENDLSRHVLIEPRHVTEYDGRWDIVPVLTNIEH